METISVTGNNGRTIIFNRCFVSFDKNDDSPSRLSGLETFQSAVHRRVLREDRKTVLHGRFDAIRMYTTINRRKKKIVSTSCVSH